MLGRAFSLVCAAVLAVAICADSHAGEINVWNDQGGNTVGVAGFHAFGVGGAIVGSVGSGNSITAINGSPVDIPLFLTFTITDVGGDITGGGYKIIGVGRDSAVIDFSITSGTVGNGVFDVQGKITDIFLNNLPGYNFAPLLGAENTVDITKAGVDFSQVVGVNGAVVRNAGFILTESVPEPSSIALFGIAAGGFLIFWRSVKRGSAA
jgi:hypothetical protein